MPIDQTDGHGNRYVLMVASRLIKAISNALSFIPLIN